MEIRKVTMLPIVALLSLASEQLVYSQVQVRHVATTDRETGHFLSYPIGFLEGNSDLSMFGLELFNKIHMKYEACRSEKHKINAKFYNESKQLIKYMLDTQKALNNAHFEKLAQENKEIVEENIERTVDELMHNREKKLIKADKKCENAVNSFLAVKMQEVLNYTRTLIQYRPSKYAQMTLDVASHGTRLREAVKLCLLQPHHRHDSDVVDPDSRGELHFDVCYVKEFLKLINFIDHFLAQADELEAKYGSLPIDDEDFYDDMHYDHSASGDQVDDENEAKPIPKTTHTQVPPRKKIPLNDLPVFEPGPVILDRDEVDNKKTTPETGTVSTVREMDTTTDKVSTEDMSSDLVNKFKDSLEPGIEIIDPKTEGELPKEEQATKGYPTEFGDEKTQDKPTVIQTDAIKDEGNGMSHHQLTTHKYPPWGDEAFEDVLKTEGKKESKTVAHKQTESEIDDEKKDPLEFEVPKNLDIDVEVNIDSQVGQQDEVTTGTDHEERSTQYNRSHFYKYVIIYFFGTFGLLLLLTIVVLVLAIAIAKKRNSIPAKDTSLLTEKEKLAVMKQSGYINPTYTYFNETSDDV